jgi:hypothetical protein
MDRTENDFARESNKGAPRPFVAGERGGQGYDSWTLGSGLDEPMGSTVEECHKPNKT